MIKIIQLLPILCILSPSTIAQSIEKTIVVNDSIELVLVQVPFDSTERKIAYGPQGLVQLIDNKLVFGTDGMLPMNELNRATINIAGGIYHLDTEGMFDPNVEIIDLEMVSVTRNHSMYFVRILFSVGAGRYGVEWTVIGDLTYRTILTYDWGILDNDFLSKEDSSHEEPR